MAIKEIQSGRRGIRQFAVGFDRDEIITARVRAAVLNEPAVRNQDIRVTTVAGGVVLDGAVDHLSQARRAAALAQSVDGVAYVMNNLVVVH